MREILFRGKTEGKWSEAEWVEGFYCYRRYKYAGDKSFMSELHTITTGIIEASGAYQEREDERKYTVIPETVGQYTGLTDKNGKKIFEGDIVKIYLYEPKGLANYEIGCIKYDDTKARFVFRTEEGNYGIDNSNMFEVIGNIHDNPELLKGGGEG